MKCIKTGCNAYIEQYGEWVHGDAYEAPSGDLVIRVCQISREPFARRHFTVLDVSHWFDRDETSAKRNSTLIAAPGVFFALAYEGEPE